MLDDIRAIAEAMNRAVSESQKLGVLIVHDGAVDHYDGTPVWVLKTDGPHNGLYRFALETMSWLANQGINVRIGGGLVNYSYREKGNNPAFEILRETMESEYDHGDHAATLAALLRVMRMAVEEMRK